jgi:hypothetical protein
VTRQRSDQRVRGSGPWRRAILYLCEALRLISKVRAHRLVEVRKRRGLTQREAAQAMDDRRTILASRPYLAGPYAARTRSSSTYLMPHEAATTRRVLITERATPDEI